MKTPSHRRPIIIWMNILCVMVMCMVVLGGVTRLTGSGLSMVAWEPFGIFPPMNEAAWIAEFARYQESPEFRHINSHMSLADFQGIFWLEYLHRIWGRLLGVVMLLPLMYFALRRKIDRPTVVKLLALFALGGGQGVLGWMMVKSGLQDQPWVSPYRLVAHLLMGFTLLALLYAQKLQWSMHARMTFTDPPLPRRVVWGLLTLLTLLVSYGGLVAGHKAGLIYTTFPWMGEHLYPTELFGLQPWLRNFYANPATVQFCHRVVAAIFVSACWFVTAWTWWGRRSPTREITWLAVAATAQAGLGIMTLLHHVPTLLGALHQAVAAVVMLMAVRVLVISR